MISANLLQAKDVNFRYYKQFKKPDHLFVIKRSDMNNEELIMIQTLQGVIAQQQPQIYIEASKAYKKWLEDLVTYHGITYQYVNSPWDLIKKYKDLLNGYLLYEPETDSVNAACTLSGLYRAVVVDRSIKKRIEEMGLKQIIDLRDKDEKWVFDNYSDKLNKNIIIQQSEINPALRDYGPAVKGLYYYEKSDMMATAEVLDWVNDDSPTLGWGPNGESSHVGISTMMKLFTVPSDHAYNLSVFSGITVDKIQQNYKPKVIKNEENVHYVTFVMSDGDNVQWHLNGYLFDEKWYGSPERGKVPMGWSTSPSLIDLAPNVMEYEYRNATKNDYFVAAVSGTGYIYPNSYGKNIDDLKLFTERMNKYLKRADLKIVEILDSPDKQTMIQYARQEQVLGGFYLTGYEYSEGKGSIYWAEGKPFVTVRDSLWATDPIEIAERINSYSKDPSTIEGYTLINVHPWTHSYHDVVAVADNLAEKVKVVTPLEFIRLIKDNVQVIDVKFN